jgi:hypothetical protein
MVGGSFPALTLLLTTVTYIHNERQRALHTVPCTALQAHMECKCT